MLFQNCLYGNLTVMAPFVWSWNKPVQYYSVFLADMYQGERHNIENASWKSYANTEFEGSSSYSQCSFILSFDSWGGSSVSHRYSNRIVSLACYMHDKPQIFSTINHDFLICSSISAILLGEQYPLLITTPQTAPSQLGCRR